MTRFILKAIIDHWMKSQGDKFFRDLWPAGTDTELFESLLDTEASPAQPFPYVTFEQLATGAQVARMTATDRTKKIRQFRTPIRFHIWANAIENDPRTAKEVAADMADCLTDVFGDNARQPQGELDLEGNGCHIQTTLMNEYYARVGDDEAHWIVDYEFLWEHHVAISAA